MKRKYIIIIGFIIVIVSAIISFSLFLIHSEDKKDEGSFKQLPSIKEKINNKENFILVITNNDPNVKSDNYCVLCNDSMKFIKLFEKMYDLNVIYFDQYKAINNEYWSLIDELNVHDFPTIPPAMFYFRDGALVAIDTEIRFENQIKKALVDYKFISEEALKEEILLTNLEDYQKINSRSFIFVYTYDDYSYEYRKIIRKIFKEYNTDYYIVCYGLVATRGITKQFRDKYGGKFRSPSLVVVDNQKIVDYTSSNDKKELRKFIKKNKKET